MELTLSKEDQIAVDLFLDKPEGGGALAGGAHLRQRLEGVERLLTTLNSLAAPELPHDLVGRTMEFIAARSTSPMVPAPQADGPHLRDAQ
jgi:hypothetical protein